MKRRCLPEAQTILRQTKLYGVTRHFKEAVYNHERQQFSIRNKRQQKKFLSREKAIETAKEWLGNVLTVSVDIWDDEGNIKMYESKYSVAERQEILYETLKIQESLKV